MGRGSWLVAATLLAGACSHGPPPCDPLTDGSCVVGQQGNPCRTDADCGDGICRPDGTCSVRTAPTTQDSQCKNVSCAAGEFCSNGQCLKANAQCRPADPACIFVPHGAFEPPVNAWWWPFAKPGGPDEDPSGYGPLRTDIDNPEFVQVMSTPVVVRLHPNDFEPAVVFNSFHITPQPGINDPYLEVHGVMRAVRGSDGSPLWTAPKDIWTHLEWSVNGNSSIAAGDCMGTGEVCFITGGWDPYDQPPWIPSTMSHRHGGIIAFGSDGRFLWVNREAQIWWGAPTIARLLGPSGPAQIVVGDGVYDGATGKTLCPQVRIGGNGDGPISIVADIDLDGIPEIVSGSQAYKLQADPKSKTGYTCKAIWGEGVKMPGGQPCPGGYQSFCPDGFPAVASLAAYGDAVGVAKDDPFPQVVVVSSGTLRIQSWAGGMLLGPIPLPNNPTDCWNGNYNMGGAPTVADFDGDGLPEIGIAGQGAYSVFKPGKGFIWSSKTFDCSSNTGSSVFDFEGKGQATVVYSDQCAFRVYDGKTGKALVETPNSSCTAYEMPLVADVDGTGRAKVLVPNNNMCSDICKNWPTPMRQSESRYFGLKALKSPSDKWVNTRSVWNEHSYHVSNVNLDGTLPFPEPDSWAPGQFNSYRQNVQGQGVFSSPDLSLCDVQVDLTQCQKGSGTVTAVVYNGGAIPSAAGILVTFYAEVDGGTTARIGEGKTTRPLRPGDSEKVSVPWKAPPISKPFTVRAVVDEAQKIGDCHYENNAATSAQQKCSPLG